MYVRIRGKSVGPLEEAKVQELVRQGKISRASEVSVDGTSWVRASEFGSLFQRGEQGAWNGNLVDESASPRPRPKGMGYFLPVTPDTQEPLIWYYSIDGRAGFGPHSRSEIGLLIRQGTLKSDGLVWKQGEMADTVRYTQDFAEFFIPKEKPKQESTTDPGKTDVPSSAEKTSDSEPSLSSPLIREAIRSGPWIMFLAIIASLGAAAIALGLLGSVCFLHSRLSPGALLFLVLASVGSIAIMIRPLLTLWKLQAAITNLAVEPNETKLQEVLHRYYLIARSLVIHLLILAALLSVSVLLILRAVGTAIG